MKKILLFTLLFSTIITNAQCYESLKFGGTHTLGLKSDGTLWGWGRSDAGQLATSTYTEPNPIPINSITNISKFYSGVLNSFVIKFDGTLWGVGYNNYGSLGINSDIISFNNWQQITTASNWTKVAPSLYFTVALKSDGTIWAWGQDDYNQTGNPPATASQNTPIQVGVATDWIDIAVGTSRTAFALKADGTLWGWGANEGYLLETNSSVYSLSSPTQITQITTWIKFSVGAQHMLAQKADGTLWSWGTGAARGIGEGIPSSNTAYQIDESVWTYFTTGLGTSFGIKTDGTLWAWGNNGDGQLGDATTIKKYVPTQIGTDTNWETVQARNYATTMATKTDGTVWYWGRNYYGEFGNGMDYVSGYITSPQLSPNICVNSLSTPSYVSKEKVNAYPNPVQNRLFIDSELTQQYQIYSILGSKISEGPLAEGSGIDCSGLTSGVYFISLTNGLGQSSTLKFVKQ